MEESNKNIVKKNPKKKTTSWGGVASWYDMYLETNDDTYQKQVILPNVLRVLDIKKGERVIDVACGQGFFAREFQKAGARVTGADISKELISQARSHGPKEIPFYVSHAHRLLFSPVGKFDIATMVFAIQNIENISDVFSEIKRVLVPNGRLVLVLNHPAFRVPKQSAWGFDEELGVQYRRVDQYLSSGKVPILMHPGMNNQKTISYHRSLQDICKSLFKNGFVISKWEEWISHKKSDQGPRQKAEDRARKEIPLFLMIEAKKDR